MVRRGRVLVLAAAAAAMACGIFGGRGERPPSPVDVEIVAAQRLNPDEHGESLPTVVRLYQLRSAAKLEAADFARLYRDAKETLGDDLLQADELTVSPGETVRRRVERAPSAKVLAAVAVLRRPSGVTWRALAELPKPGDDARAKFVVEEYRIERR